MSLLLALTALTDEGGEEEPAPAPAPAPEVLDPRSIPNVHLRLIKRSKLEEPVAVEASALAPPPPPPLVAPQPLAPRTARGLLSLVDLGRPRPLANDEGVAPAAPDTPVVPIFAHVAFADAPVVELGDEPVTPVEIVVVAPPSPIDYDRAIAVLYTEWSKEQTLLAAENAAQLERTAAAQRAETEKLMAARRAAIDKLCTDERWRKARQRREAQRVAAAPAVAAELLLEDD